MILKSEQRRLYTLMPAEARCFVRICDSDHALWVSDFPRRMEDCSATEVRLHQKGFSVQLDEVNRLWYIDWTEERWQEMSAGMPCKVPAFPACEKWHECYALCRLYLLHPSEIEKEHLSAVRTVLKLNAMPDATRMRAVRALHEEASKRLREGKTIAYAAGRVLAAWLNEAENGKETQL